MLVKILEENRVESRGVRFDPGARTALAFVTLREDGEREFMFYRNPSADMLLDVHELDVELIQQVLCPHLHSLEFCYLNTVLMIKDGSSQQELTITYFNISVVYDGLRIRHVVFTLYPRSPCLLEVVSLSAYHFISRTSFRTP